MEHVCVASRRVAPRRRRLVGRKAWSTAVRTRLSVRLSVAASLRLPGAVTPSRLQAVRRAAASFRFPLVLSSSLRSATQRH